MTSKSTKCSSKVSSDQFWTTHLSYYQPQHKKYRSYTKITKQNSETNKILQLQNKNNTNTWHFKHTNGRNQDKNSF